MSSAVPLNGGSDEPEFMPNPEIDNESCLNCPVQLYCKEEAGVSLQIGKEESIARAWMTFGDNILKACNKEEPIVYKRRKFWLFGKDVYVVDCASSSAKAHKKDITRMILPVEPE